MNGLGMSGDWSPALSVISGLEFDWWNVAAVFVEAAVVKPVDLSQPK
jgi:hypothetical protein